jgi:glycosyltransferase involved in cell wall biosynthesis
MVFMLAPPLPAVAGGDIYAANALLPFADRIDFHLFCFVGGQADVDKIAAHRTEYDRVFRSIHMQPRPAMPFQLPRVRRYIRLASQALRGNPFIDASYFSRSAVAHARRLAKRHQIAAIEVNSAHLAFFARYLRVPALLVGHNIESDVFPFWVTAGLRGWRLRFMQWVAARSRRAARNVEIENGFGFAAMTFISRADMARVQANVAKFHVPLFFDKDVAPYAMRPTDCFNVLWMGGFGWYPNAEGVGWFVDNVLPLLRDRLEPMRLKLHFCGSHPPADLVARHDGKHVFVHGFVDDIDTMLRDAHLLIVPLLSGGGIRVKIIEAMAAGVPVLCTRKGCEGIGVEDGQGVIIRDEPARFAEEIVAAAKEPARMRALSEAGLRFIGQHHSREAGLAAKEKAYMALGVLP